MPQVSLSGSLNYTAPGGGTVNQDIVSVGSYLASSLGTIDVPSGSSSGATFSVPLGGVAIPVAMALKNGVGTAVRVSFQSNPTGFQLTDGGWFTYTQPKTPLTLGITAVSIVLSAAQTAPGEIVYEIFGD